MAQAERIHQADQQGQFQLKENEDLKHDNTILYKNNVQNKERLDQVQIEIEEMKRYIESEKQKSGHLENEGKRLTSKIQHLEDLIKAEKDRVHAKER